MTVCLKAPYPSGKGEVCKTFMRRFESVRRLSTHSCTVATSRTLRNNCCPPYVNIFRKPRNSKGNCRAAPAKRPVVKRRRVGAADTGENVRCRTFTLSHSQTRSRCIGSRCTDLHLCVTVRMIWFAVLQEVPFTLTNTDMTMSAINILRFCLFSFHYLHTSSAPPG